MPWCWPGLLLLLRHGYPSLQNVHTDWDRKGVVSCKGYFKESGGPVRLRKPDLRKAVAVVPECLANGQVAEVGAVPGAQSPEQETDVAAHT